jgi:hypothetical protein
MGGLGRPSSFLGPPAGGRHPGISATHSPAWCLLTSKSTFARTGISNAKSHQPTLAIYPRGDGIENSDTPFGSERSNPIGVIATVGEQHCSRLQAR